MQLFAEWKIVFDACLISPCCGRGYTWHKVAVHSSVQWWEVQSGRSIMRSLISCPGSGVGVFRACGCKIWKALTLSRDSASARALYRPGRRSAWSTHWWWAVRNARQRSKCADSFSTDVWLLIVTTAAVLSESTWMTRPFHASPQIAVAITTGVSSFAEMCCSMVVETIGSPNRLRNPSSLMRQIST